MPSLVYLSEDANRMVFSLGAIPITVGRGDGVQIQLSGEGILPNHAWIFYENGQFVLQDNGSPVGSYVNGMRVTRQPLKNRDMIRFGQYIFMVDLEDQPSPPPPSPPPAPSPVVVVQTPAAQGPVMQNAANVPLRVKTQSGARVAAAAMLRPKSVQVAGATARLRPKTMLNMPVPTNPEHDRYALLSYICGLLAPIGFLPAIFFGHMAGNVRDDLAKKRNLGLTLGYIFLVIWGGVAIHFVNRPKSSASRATAAALQSTRLEIPPVKDPLGLLRGEMMWCPPRQVVLKALSSTTGPKGSTATVSYKGGNETAALADARSTWNKGVIIYEPDFLRMTFGSDGLSVRYVIEDCKNNPTFWGFNSTVVPAKKNVLGLFIVPGLDRWTFFERNRELSVNITKFNAESVPWSQAMRGVQFAIGEIPPDIRKKSGLLKCGIMLKPAAATCRLVIATREGDALKDWDRTYSYDLYPAEFIGFFLYNFSTKALFDLQLNSALFAGETAETARKLIREGFVNIVDNRPPTPNHLGLPFKLESKGEAAPESKTPVDTKSAPPAVTPTPPPATTDAPSPPATPPPSPGPIPAGAS